MCSILANNLLKIAGCVFLFMYAIFCLLQFVRIIQNENPLRFFTFSLSCALPVKIIRAPSIQSFKLLKIK